MGHLGLCSGLSDNKPLFLEPSSFPNIRRTHHCPLLFSIQLRSQLQVAHFPNSFLCMRSGGSMHTLSLARCYPPPPPPVSTSTIKRAGRFYLQETKATDQCWIVSEIERSNNLMNCLLSFIPLMPGMHTDCRQLAGNYQRHCEQGGCDPVVFKLGEIMNASRTHPFQQSACMDYKIYYQ